MRSRHGWEQGPEPEQGKGQQWGNLGVTFQHGWKRPLCLRAQWHNEGTISWEIMV